MATNDINEIPGKVEEVAAEFRNERNSSGFFILTEETEDFSVPDPSLDQEERINQAIEIFESSLTHKPRETTRVYLVS
jgi:hypothetical protein